MAPRHSISSSSSRSPPLAPSRRQSMRAHSDSYHPIYSASSSASSETSSIFSHASSSSSATSASSRRSVSHKVPRMRTARPGSSLAAPPSSVSVPLCSPETGNTKIVLPRTLARPQPQTVSNAALAAVGADLENVPLAYIIQTLKDIGPRMMATLARTTAPAPTSLPRDLEVRVVPDTDPDQNLDTLPTHLLAVYARSNVDVTPAREGMVSRRKVTLFPTHAVMLAAHCAHLPPLPPGGKRTAKEPDDGSQMLQDEGQVPDSTQATVDSDQELDDETHEDESQTADLERRPKDADTEDSPPAPESPMHGVPDDPSKPPPPPPAEPLASHITLTLPVVPLCIPAPKMFPILQSYLYTKRADHLLSALVPNPHVQIASSTPTPTLPPPSSPSPLSLGAPSPPASESDSTPRPSPAPSSPTPTPTPLPTLVPDAATLSAQLAEVHPAPTLVSAALRTHGVWANAAALGVFDERLWLTIDFAWRVLLSALERGAAQVAADVDSRSDSDDEDKGRYGDGNQSDRGKDEPMHEEVDDRADGEKLSVAKLQEENLDR